MEIAVAGLVLLVAVVIFEVKDVHYEQECSIVTDKWINTGSNLLYGWTDYVLELDNNRTVDVDDFEFHNHEINESYCFDVPVDNGDGWKKLWEK